MVDQNKISFEIYQLFVQTISQAKNIETMGHNLVQLIVSALEIKGATIFVLDPESEELEVLASAGLSMNYIHKGPILVDKSIKFGANRTPVVISDVETSDELQYPEKAREEGVRAIVSYPINMRGKIIGSLRLYHKDVWEISEEDKMFIEVTTGSLGIALMYFRVATAVSEIKETVNDIHPIWL